MEGDLDFEFFILFECDYIFNNREEIFILEVILYYLYFLDIIKYIKFLDDDCYIFLLIGWDFIEVYYVLYQIFGLLKVLYVQ